MNMVEFLFPFFLCLSHNSSLVPLEQSVDVKLKRILVSNQLIYAFVLD